jgi:hypothetical protein
MTVKYFNKIKYFADHLIITAGFIFLISLVFISQTSFAEGPTISAVSQKACAMLFADLVDTSEEWLDVESYTLARENGQLIPTVKPHEGAITFGVHGHPVYLLERKHESWYTTYKHSGNLHGDPRNFIRMFTPNGARFFSFLMLSPTEMIIPGALEMNAAIDSFNKDLSIKDRIPIRFYTTGLHLQTSLHM